LVFFNKDDLVKSQRSRRSCASSPAYGGTKLLELAGFPLFNIEGNDENGTKRTFYESIKKVAKKQ